MQLFSRPLVLLAALLIPSLAAAQRQAITPPGVRPSATLSQAVRFGDVLYISGQIGMSRGSADTTIQAQTQKALDNLKAVVEAGGSTMANVVQCTVFLVDLKDFAGMNSVYTKVFATEPPARSTVVVAALVTPGGKIEISCIAGIPK
jgi:reactive intermediate/imine deaminase